MKNKKLIAALLAIFSVLIVDQWLKIYIKTSFYYGEKVAVLGDWFSLLFVENPGMAYGWEIPFLPGDVAKILLSSFRIVAVVIIAFYLRGLIKKQLPTGLIVSIALVFAGALGNILDSLFYGLMFSASSMHNVATWVPFGTGYTGVLTGDVVDMLSFDLFTVDLPFYGEFNFFAPIFNVADFAISLGVGIILVFHRKNFQKNFFNSKQGDENEVEEQKSQNPSEPVAVQD